MHTLIEGKEGIELVMKKRKSHAFGKYVYLLGKDVDGVLYWLQEPKYDCGWYWGFGYIETFTNNLYPERSKDINSHSHADNFMREYFTEWNGSQPILSLPTFTNKEGWELSELFEQFYFLRSAAENFRRGKCHCADSQVKLWKKPELTKEINEILIPKVTARILEILTP
jgi:hypothetical protein